MQPLGWVGRFAENARSGVSAPYVAAGVLWLGALVFGHGTVAGRSVVPDEFSRARFPVAAVAEARRAGLQGRLFHDFMWGGYLLYGWPETKVFIDGGTDFYGSGLIRTYRSIMGLEPGWRDSLDTREIGTVLTRPRAALAGVLDRDTTWLRWYCDSVAVLFARRTPAPPTAVPSRPGCPLP